MQIAAVASPQTEPLRSVCERKHRRVSGPDLVGTCALILVPSKAASLRTVPNLEREKRMVRNRACAGGSMSDLTDLAASSGAVALPPLLGELDVASIELRKRRYNGPTVAAVIPIAKIWTSAK